MGAHQVGHTIGNLISVYVSTATHLQNFQRKGSSFTTRTAARQSPTKRIRMIPRMPSMSLWRNPNAPQPSRASEKSASAWSPFGRRGILQSHFGRACGLHNESPTRQQGWRPVAWPLCGHWARHRRDGPGLRGQTLVQQSYIGPLGHPRRRPSRRGRRAAIVHMPAVAQSQIFKRCARTCTISVNT